MDENYENFLPTVEFNAKISHHHLKTFFIKMSSKASQKIKRV